MAKHTNAGQEELFHAENTESPHGLSTTLLSGVLKLPTGAIWALVWDRDTMKVEWCGGRDRSYIRESGAQRAADQQLRQIAALKAAREAT